MKLIIVHYHLRPGGIRRVIEMAVPPIVERLGGKAPAVILATGESPENGWLRSFQRALGSTPVEVQTIPAFGYFSEQRASVIELRQKICDGVRSLLAHSDPEDTLVWAHNLALGRNLLLTRELVRACAAQGFPLVAHQHDWWFENRWQRWPELRRCGFRNLRSVADAALPAGARVAHATINCEDTAILEKHFPGRVFWLPNPTQPAPAAARLRQARGWLRKELGSAAPVWMVPCRLLRRKNLAEALLLTRWLRPEAWLVTTGGISSADEQEYAGSLRAAARAHGWPLRLGILAGDERAKPGIAELLAASEAVLLTSIQEGFGLPNLEAAAAGRPLLARRLPNIAPDLEKLGFRFPQSYDEILIAPGLFDFAAEVRRQERLFGAWIRGLPRGCRAWAGQPVVLAPSGAQPVPFSRLTLAAQLEVLRHPAEASWQICAPLNPFLPVWKKRAAAGRLRVTPWPRRAAKWLSGPAYAAQFENAAESARIASSAAVASGAAQEEFIRARLDSAHLFPILWSIRM